MPAESGEDLFPSLINAQNRDGGWGYAAGSSWTEPTVYALLAETARKETSASFERGVRWLDGARRKDGGWSPHPSVAESTWVTALAVLLLSKRAGGYGTKNIDWLVRQTGQESTLVFRLRQWLAGYKNDYEETPSGWSWYPGTAAWVMPTSLSILALESEDRRRPSADLKKRIASGRQFLLSRTCQDGGWNHGSSRALGYQLVSYPETTGVALLALHGVQSPKIGPALAAAEKHFETCRSPEGFGWLKLALLSHGVPLPKANASVPPRRNPEIALSILADAAVQGSNIFLE